MPFFDALMGLMGSPDPRDEARQLADQQQAQNRAAVGMDANGNPLPSPDGSQAAPPPGTLPPSQEPNATKTPLSWGHVLMDLQQRDEAKQGWNQALGMGLSAFAHPAARHDVSQMFNVKMPDENQTVQTIMNAGSNQQGQDRANAVGQMVNDQTPQGQAKLAALAKSLNMEPVALQALGRSNPAGLADLIAKAGVPTDQMKNIEQINRYIGGIQGKSPEVLSMIKNAMLAGMAGPDAEAAVGDAVAYKNRTGQDAPWLAGGAVNQQIYKQYQANEAQKESDRSTASASLVDNNETAQRLQGDLETLKDMPGLKSILTTPGKRVIAQQALADNNALDAVTILAKYVGLTSAEADAIALLKRVGGATTEQAMKGMAGTGTRVTQAEVGPLKDAITTTQNLNQSYESYIHGALNGAITRAKKTVATNFGATGNVKNMDPQYAPWLDPNFKKGGELYKEGSGVDELPAAGLVPADEVATVKAVLKDKPYLKDEALDNWQQRGFDTRKLRSSSPASW